MIRIASRIDGFRRCGMAHPTGPVDHPDDRFTPDEIAVLEAEPALMVQRVAPAAPDDPAERIAAIRAARARLDPDNPELWTASGKAKCEALQALLGWEPSGADRDEAEPG